MDFAWAVVISKANEYAYDFPELSDK